MNRIGLCFSTRQLLVESLEIIRQSFVINTHQVKYGGVDISYMNRITHDKSGARYQANRALFTLLLHSPYRASMTIAPDASDLDRFGETSFK